jgi:uncharacterized protein YggE
MESVSSTGPFEKVMTVAMVVAVAAVLASTVVLVSTLNERLSQVAGTGSEPRRILVNGIATVTLVPDEARLTIGVVTRGETAEEASRKNAEAMSKVIEALRGLGLTDKETQTKWLSVNADYDCSGRKCVVAGYVATNTVEVKLRSEKFHVISEVIDRSVAAGANLVQGVQFTVSEERRRSMEEDLLRAAVADAKRKAQKAAEELGAGIRGVLNVDLTIDQAPYPIVPTVVRAESGASTPVVPGEVTVTARVQVSFEIG